MATAISLTVDRILELAEGWEGVASDLSDTALQVGQIQITMIDNQAALDEFQNIILPELQAAQAANDAAVSNLNDTTLAELQATVDANVLAIDTLNQSTIPGLTEQMNSNAGWILELNDVTLPALDTRLLTAEGEVDSLEGRFPVVADDLAADAVTANKIAADAVTANAIAAGTITADEIAANTITANEIAADTITANEIAADTITAAEIAANAITAAEIAADTITANEIAADAITANEIAADTITANEIAADAITANEIAADTITASEIAAGTISASEIAAEAIISEHIKAGEISAIHLTADVILASTRIAAEGSLGQSVEMNPQGFFVYGPDSEGNPAYVSFPTEGGVGGKPNIISGTLQATTLTVEGNSSTGQAATFRRNSVVEPGATLTLNNSIPAPIAAPGMESITNQKKATGTTNAPGNEGSGVIVGGEFYFPVWKAAGTNTYTNKVYKINLTTFVLTEVASSVAYGVVNTVKLMSVTKLGSDWYGLFYNASTKLNYLSKLDTSTAAWFTISSFEVSTALVGSNYDKFREAMAVTHDGTDLWVATQDGNPSSEGNYSARLRFRRYAASMVGTALETIVGNLGYMTDPTDRNRFTGFEVGNMDFGARKFVTTLWWANSQQAVDVYDNAGVDDNTLRFSMQSGETTPSLLAWDGTRFWDINKRNIGDYWVSKYSRYFSTSDSTTNMETQYGWATTYRSSDSSETVVSPRGSVNLRSRWWLKMTIATPSAGLGARLYVSTTTVSTGGNRQTTLAAGVTSYDLDLYDTAGVAPPTTSGFGATTPSVIQSEETITSTVSVGTTSASNQITGTGIKSYMAGRRITGTGIPANATIVSVVSGVSAIISAPATATGTITATLTLPKMEIRGDGYARITELESVLLTSPTDAALSAGNKPPLRIGDPTGTHMRLDGNEIISMVNDSSRTGGTLTLSADDITLNAVGGGVRVEGHDNYSAKIRTVNDNHTALIFGFNNVAVVNATSTPATYSATNTVGFIADDVLAYGTVRAHAGLFDESYSGGGSTGATINNSGRLVRTGSSRRFKKEIRPLSLDQARKALDLEAVSYKWRAEMDMGDRRTIGFIAEQASDAGADLLIDYDADGVVSGFKYGELTAAHNVLLKEIIRRLQILEAA